VFAARWGHRALPDFRLLFVVVLVLILVVVLVVVLGFSAGARCHNGRGAEVSKTGRARCPYSADLDMRAAEWGHSALPERVG